MKKYIYLIICLIILASFILGVYLLPKMPEQMASHWNVHGQVDGYMSKFWGLFLMPLVTLALFILFLVLPLIDPLKENVKKFRLYFDLFILLLILYLAYIYALSLAWNLGYYFNMNIMMIPALAILFVYIGILLQHAKRNWFIGIRTPWTLSNDKVWDKTHALGSRLFIACGILCLFGFIWPHLLIWFVLIPALASTLWVTIYSYLEFRKE